MRFAFLLVIPALLLLISACSEVEEEITTAPEVGVHGTGVLDPASEDYHGTLLVESGGFASCMDCHAADLNGGTAGQGCNQCHNGLMVHKEGINSPSSENFHGKYIAADNWGLGDCVACHGDQFTGSSVSPGCTSSGCHSVAGGPAACTTCHGNFGTAGKGAPPEDLDGNSETSAQGVGAHQAHLGEKEISDNVYCTDCHIMPEAWNSEGHLGSDGAAEVLFSGDVNSNAASTPSYDYAGGSCANTYCHGNFVFRKSESSNQYAYEADQMTGNMLTMKWTDGDDAAECGTCHDLPPKGHVAYDISECSACHGEVVNGEGEIVNTALHINGKINVAGDGGFHGDGVMNPESDAFHGKLVGQNDFDYCRSCHGEDLEGGAVGVGCTSCHQGITVHVAGINTPSNEAFHGKYIAANSWALWSCASCHGEEYTGSDISTSCATSGCHSFDNGPESCNTCHGDFADANFPAPPEDIEGNTETSARGVGAHTAHLYEAATGANVACESCHTPYADFEATGHIGDDNDAEVNFGGELIGKSATTPVYDYEKGSCANTYCHGNFVYNKASSDKQYAYSADQMAGNNVTVSWTDGDDAAECGSCHNLPPTGHVDYDISECANCHSGVINAQGEIIDPELHINGVANAGGGFHGEGVMDEDSEDFHGELFEENDFDYCRECHGEDLAGGTSGVSCLTCHPGSDVHEEGALLPSSEDFHGKYIGANDWAVNQCASCHGETYAGSEYSPSCATSGCHTPPAGPEACNTCHGDFNNVALVAPPQDLEGNIEPANRGVGAHQTHLYKAENGPTLSCSNCHQWPSSFEAEGHIDGDNRAELQFSGNRIDKSVGTPTYDYNNGTCSNIYCHGSFEFRKEDSRRPYGYTADAITGENATVSYTGGSNEVLCGSCHGVPPEGHIASDITECANCHGDVVDGLGNIIDGKKHMDGETNFLSATHGAGAMEPTSPQFHGQLAATTGIAGCAVCHGADLEGKPLVPGCVSCHESVTVHKAGINNPSNDAFHGKFINANGWELANCESCHGSEYQGSAYSPSCATSGCHTQPAGPKACNTCHGDFDNPNLLAPPQDLEGNTEYTALGVGAHQKHLFGVETAGSNLTCSNCHRFPSSYGAPEHIDADGRAEVMLAGELVDLSPTTPLYDTGTGTCMNTYCHGNFVFKKSESQYEFVYTAEEMVGNNPMVSWTGGPKAGTCGTCHDLPPKGHQEFKVTECYNCHGSVIDEFVRIIDPDKHIDGKVNAFDN